VRGYMELRLPPAATVSQGLPDRGFPPSLPTLLVPAAPYAADRKCRVAKSARAAVRKRRVCPSAFLVPSTAVDTAGKRYSANGTPDNSPADPPPHLRTRPAASNECIRPTVHLKR